MSGSSETNSNGHQSLELSDQKNKIKLLRKTLLDRDDRCKKYIEAGQEEILLRILRVKSFDVEKAAEAIERVELYKVKYPEVFSVPFEEYAKAYEKEVFNVLRHRDVKGRTVSHVKLKNWHLAEISLEAVTRATTLLAEELLQNEETQINGTVAILDFKDVGFTQMTKFISTVSFHVAKRGNDFMKGGSIIKVKAVYFINTPSAVLKLVKVIKLILSKKVKERLLFCNPDSTEFTSNFREEDLPKSLNGVLNEEDAHDLDFIRTLCEKQSNSSK